MPPFVTRPHRPIVFVWNPEDSSSACRLEKTICATQFLGNLGFQRGNTHSAAYPLLWNLIGNHDTARILHLCGEDKCRQKLAALFFRKRWMKQALSA